MLELVSIHNPCVKTKRLRVTEGTSKGDMEGGVHLRPGACDVIVVQDEGLERHLVDELSKFCCSDVAQVIL